MKYPCGAIAISETGFVSGNNPFMLEVHGTEGNLTICGADVRLRTSKGDYPGVVVPNLPPAIPQAIDQFVDAILNGGEIIFGMDDAIGLTEMMVAAYKAHKEGGFVKV